MNMDEAVRRLAEVVRRKHITLATERTCCAWLRRCWDFLKRLPLLMTNERKLEWLRKKHSAASRNQSERDLAMRERK
jgi:hypothetical protein